MIYQDKLYWGNTAQKNLCCVPLDDLPALRTRPLKSGNDSREGTELADHVKAIPLFSYRTLANGHPVHGICFVPEHQWIIWMDWSRDVLVILTLNGEHLFTSSRVGTSVNGSFIIFRR